MGIVRFDIELDNPTKTYLHGSVLSGKVHLDLDAPKPVKSIKLTVSGEGKISWERTRFAVKMKDIYPAEYLKEVHIDDDIYLLGLDGATVIPEGQHIYPFTYKLPETIPPSYADEFGTIEYSVNVSIQRVWYLWNHRRSTEFKVLGPFDLNSDHKAAEPVRQDISKTFMGCSNPVDMTVWLPVCGYIPGQSIPVTVDIRNGAKVNIKEVCFALIKVNLYHGSAKTRREEVVFVKHKTPMPESSNIETRIGHLLRVPPVQPSFLKHSKLIDLEYRIRIEVRVGGLHKNFELDVPIIIGTAALLVSTDAISQGAFTPQNNDAGILYSEAYNNS